MLMKINGEFRQEEQTNEEMDEHPTRHARDTVIRMTTKVERKRTSLPKIHSTKSESSKRRKPKNSVIKCHRESNAK